jgi:hypothetical protein
MTGSDAATSQAGSVRLTFAYDNGGLRLVSRTPRRKPPPPTAPLDREPPPNTVVVELRSQQDAVQYRQLLTDPIPQSLEVIDPDGQFRRVAYARPTGGFSVVVPRPAAAAVVVVLAGPQVELAQPGLAPPPGVPPGWRELARLTLGGGRDGHG